MSSEQSSGAAVLLVFDHVLTLDAFSSRCQCVQNGLAILGDDGEIGAGGGVGLAAAL
jgi:hypothetical protein